MDKGTFRIKLGDADKLLDALRVCKRQKTRESLEIEIPNIINSVVGEAKRQGGDEMAMKELLESILRTTSYDLCFENVLGAYHYMYNKR